ncbi:MAG: hypothetical protein ACE5ER_06015 [Nitrospinaceae bacterium]
MAHSRKTIAVIGSGTHPFTALSEALGSWLAQKGYHLVTGGGGGVMQAVARGFSQVQPRGGMVLGILPAAAPCTTPLERRRHQPAPGYPNPYVDLPVVTHLPLSGKSGKDTASRNHIVVLTGDLVLALPGGAGTRSEILLAMEYQKPLIVLNDQGVWDEFRNSPAHLADTLEEVLAKIEAWDASPAES